MNEPEKLEPTEGDLAIGRVVTYMAILEAEIRNLKAEDARKLRKIERQNKIIDDFMQVRHVDD